VSAFIGRSKSEIPPSKEKAMADEYDLLGPQVEPKASFWNRCSQPRIVSLDDLREAGTDDSNSPNFFPPYPDSDTPEGQAIIDAELAELRELELLRKDPNALVGGPPERERKQMSVFLTGGDLTIFSKKIKFSPPPLGAIVRTTRLNEPLVQTGLELARYFEGETPGLAHRHALNGLIRVRDWSPARQAWVWAALDVAISSALLAAWHYKWLATGRTDLVARRQRPYEYTVSQRLPPLNVLYDTEVQLVDGMVVGEVPDGTPRTKPMPSPGTPRHPAYPSGHSTYSGAASELLSCFFPEAKEELDKLADNIGMARLWAGIHWRTDHINGMALGRTVARLVIDQLNSTGVEPAMPPTDPSPPIPTRAELRQEADAFESNCGNGNGNLCTPPAPPSADSLQRAIGPQQGAR